jgi:hypothetical protein
MVCVSATCCNGSMHMTCIIPARGRRCRMEAWHPETIHPSSLSR